VIECILTPLALQSRVHRFDGVPGFQRMEVLRPHDTPAEFWLTTWWSSDAAIDEWHHSHLYRESHRGIPKGLKLVSGSVQISCMELIATGSRNDYE